MTHETNLATTSWRRVVGSLVVAVSVGAVTTCFFAPRFVFWPCLAFADVLPTVTPEFDRAQAALGQLGSPWDTIANPTHRVLAWRLLFPLSCHYLRMPWWAFLALPPLGCLLALWLVAWVMGTAIADWKYVWLTTALFAFLPWYFVSSGWLAYFDSWLVLGLVAVAFVPARWALAAACLLEPWIDERFVLALPTCLLVRAAALRDVEGRTRRSFVIDLGLIAKLSIPYLVVRLVFWSRGDEVTNFYVHTHAELLPLIDRYRYLAGLWSGFRAGWVVVAVAVYFYGRRAQGYWTLSFASLVVAMAAGGLFLAADMSRTMTILAPVFLLGARLWWNDAPRSSRWALPLILMANLLLPAAHEMWHLEIPIHSLPAEIASWRNAPPEIRAGKLLHEGRLHVQEGRLDEALANFDTVISVEPRYTEAFSDRAALRLALGDHEGAGQDLAIALLRNPDDPRSLFLRGMLNAATGDSSRAVDDLHKALESPKPWPQRAAAERYLEEITRGPKRE